MSLLAKENFRILFDLQKKQPWIANEKDALVNLLFSECPKVNHRNLIIELISRFEYLSNKRYMKMLNELAEDIVTDPDLRDESTQLVAMAADSTADSSQYVLYGLKPLLEKFEWRKYHQVNNFGKVHKVYKKFNGHKNIILIDEFVGTGDTVIGRVKEIQRVFKSKNISNYLIKVKVLVAAEKGMNNIKLENIEISSRIILKRGISDHYPNTLASKMINLMIELERLLLETYKETKLPSLGYGRVESLYCRENGNTPNSVFPIFWWPFYRNGDSRCTILTRAMNDA